MGELHRTGVPRILVIAGSGDARALADLHTLARQQGLMPGEDVVFTGIIEEPDVPILYNLCDLFVYPSSYEGFGLPPLEAMATGRPVVVSDTSSFPELYQGTAVLVELGSPLRLAEAIDQISRDEVQRSELIDRGLKLARSRSWRDVAQETLDVYRRVEGRGHATA
jgi:glycosyltransferase involved in cell wall biosynthesis